MSPEVALIPEWLVALEATSERGRIDIAQLARQLRSVGDARPSDPTGRYTLILRPTDRDPAEALRSAVGEWQKATADLGQHGARLLGARVIQPDTMPPRRRALGVHIARPTATRSASSPAYSCSSSARSSAYTPSKGRRVRNWRPTGG